MHTYTVHNTSSSNHLILEKSRCVMESAFCSMKHKGQEDIYLGHNYLENSIIQKTLTVRTRKRGMLKIMWLNSIAD